MRYAKALMAYAEERGAEERLYHELVTLAHSFRTVKGFCAVLDNPIVSVNEKFNLICTAADGDHKPSEEFIRFIRLVLIGVGKLITAVPVDKATEERIRQTAAHILHAYMELETVVDPSIEGGFVFDINDYRLDASIATQLKKVKQQFIDKNRRIV